MTELSTQTMSRETPLKPAGMMRAGVYRGKRQVVVEHVPVWLGTSPTVPLVGGRNLIVTMPRNWRTTASIKVSYDTPIQAPVSKGTPLEFTIP